MYVFFIKKTKCPEKNFNKSDVFEKCIVVTFLKFFLIIFMKKLNMVKMYSSFICITSVKIKNCIEYQYFCKNKIK